MVTSSSSSPGRRAAAASPRDATRREPTTGRCARATETFERWANDERRARGRRRAWACAARRRRAQRRRRRARAARDQGLGVGVSRICTFATCGVSRERGRGPARVVMNARVYVLRAHVQRHQFRERLRLAKSLEFGGVRLLRLANGKHRPHKGGDLRARNERTSGQSLSLSDSLVHAARRTDERRLRSSAVVVALPFSRSRPRASSLASTDRPTNRPTPSSLDARITHHPRLSPRAHTHAPNTSKTRSARIPNRSPPGAPSPCTPRRRG